MRALALMLTQMQGELGWIIGHSPRSMQAMLAQETTLDVDKDIKMFQVEGKGKITICMVTQEQMNAIVEAEQKAAPKVVGIDGKALGKKQETDVGIAVEFDSEL